MSTLSILAALISERAHFASSDLASTLPPAIAWLVIGVGLILAGWACRVVLGPWVNRLARSIRRKLRLDGPSPVEPCEARAILVRNILSLQHEAARLNAQLAIHADPKLRAELEAYQSSLDRVDRRIDVLKS